MARLKRYQEKRNFSITAEPKGKIVKKHSKLHFVVHHHLASHDHYDLRLELNGVLKSFALPKIPSYNPQVKRLAILVEDHPYSYRHFEGIIPFHEYGAGIVQIWDEGYFTFDSAFPITFKDQVIKITLMGKRLKGKWTLIPLKDNQWLLRKEKDEYVNFYSLAKFTRSVKSGNSLQEIRRQFKEKKQRQNTISGVNITKPNKIIFLKEKITKYDLALYYQKVFKRMFPFLENRLTSTIRSIDHNIKNSFYVRHFDLNVNPNMRQIYVTKNKSKKDYAYFLNLTGVIKEVQLNGYEFHLWANTVNRLNSPDMMVFDFDPDENVSLAQLRQGVKDLKIILDELGLKSFLKTSGGKGYHVVIPFTRFTSWQKFTKFAQQIAELMVLRYPEKYVTSISKKARKNKIFIDWHRNKKGATSVAPYSVRLRDKLRVSMPISWRELMTIAPDEVTIQKALQLIKKKNPWEDFFFVLQ